MKPRIKTFLYTLAFIIPFVMSILTQSQLNDMLKLNMVYPIFLGIVLVAYASSSYAKENKELYECFKFLLVFDFYMLCVSVANSNTMFAVDLLLVISTAFTFWFLGYEVRRFGYICYLYALVSIVIGADFAAGGITGGWNTNSIAIIIINGAYFLMLSIDIENKRQTLIKLLLSAIILVFVVITNCRSVIIGFTVFLIIRYIIFANRRLSRKWYKIICSVLMLSPYFIMQIYLSLYNSSLRESLDKFMLEHTQKLFFTERELIWNRVFERDLTGLELFFGTGTRHINAHNLFVDIVYSFGLIGAVMFFILFAMLLFRMYKYYSDSIIRGSVACFLAIMVSQTFESIYFSITTVHFNIMLYLFIAIGVGRYVYLSEIEKLRKRIEVNANESN